MSLWQHHPERHPTSTIGKARSRGNYPRSCFVHLVRFAVRDRQPRNTWPLGSSQDSCFGGILPVGSQPISSPRSSAFWARFGLSFPCLSWCTWEDTGFNSISSQSGMKSQRRVAASPRPSMRTFGPFRAGFLATQELDPPRPHRRGRLITQLSRPGQLRRIGSKIASKSWPGCSPLRFALGSR
jgi:hypothetical protein